MKNAKKLISLLLAIGTIFSLAACGKSDKATGGDSELTASKTMASNQVTEEKIEDEKTSEMPSTPTEKAEAVKTDKFLKVSAKDEENLTDFLAYVIGYGREYIFKDPPCGDDGYSEEDYFNYNYKNYDCTKNDAFEYAFTCMLGLPYYSIFDWFEGIYAWDNAGIVDEYIGSNEYDETLPVRRDPLKKFEPEYSYSKIKGSKFDALLKELFNVEPIHDFVLNGKSSRWFEDNDSAYYYNGYYYVVTSEGGDGAGPKTVINNIEETSDGKYNINITYQFGNDFEGYEDIAKLNVVAGLKNIDGERIWSIYRIEKD